MNAKHAGFWLTAVLLAGLPAAPCRAGGGSPAISILDTAGRAVLAAPVADLAQELTRNYPGPAAYHVVTNADAFDGLAAELDLADLAAALKKTQVSPAEADALCAAHRLELDKLANWLAAPDSSAPAPRFIPTVGLPDEFADYFEGAVAWADPARTNQEAARESWREVLNLPAPERRFKSTWAAFMLGKSWQKENPARAAPFFQRTRELSGRGFADSPGLAAASLGLEAQCECLLGNFAAALPLYLELWAAGDAAAGVSLQAAAIAAVKNENNTALAALARNSAAQRVVTACLISHPPPGGTAAGREVGGKWLAAAEAAGAPDAASAEALALLACQVEDWEAAQRWDDRVLGTPLSQWLLGKLLLHSGKVSQADALLGKVTALFPLQPPPKDGSAPLREHLHMPTVGVDTNEVASLIPAPREILGELGAADLAMGRYRESLDAFARSGFETDATYVAERVLTVAELKDYVEQNCAAGADDLAEGIRNRLAQRLARLHRTDEARAYYSASVMPDAVALAQALARSTDTSLSAEDRAASFLAAAILTQSKGMALFGKDAHGTNAADGIFSARQRDSVLPPSQDESRRARESAPESDEESHFPFQAAELAWQAALLMPDNSGDTARVLCQAGTWIKSLDPKKADVFYKALVRRCRRTAIGAQADKMRWFPLLDADGNLLPYEP